MWEAGPSERGAKKKGLRTRAYQQYDDGKDDDEPEPAVKQEVEVKRKAKEARSAEVVNKPRTPPPRIILLRYRTNSGEQRSYPLPESIVEQIPEYKEKIREAEADFWSSFARPTARTTVEDPIERDEEGMIQVVEYLTSATRIAPLVDSTWGPSIRDRMQQLVKLSKTATALGMQDLRREALEVLTAETVMKSVDLQTFLIVAKELCQPDSGFNILDDSVVGKWLRTYIVTNFEELQAEYFMSWAARKCSQIAELFALLKEVLQKRA